jgi:type IV pilus assembly protein PilM
MARTLVGLDIGSSGVRAAEITLGRRPALRRFASAPLPDGVVRAGAVVDPDALTEALKTLWSQAKLGTKTVVLGIANAGVLVRQMDLDWMPPADFRKALRFQVEDSLPIPVDDANLDYHLLKELEAPGDTGEVRRVARVLLVAAARDMVDGFVESAHRAGLRPLAVDLVPFALVRASGTEVRGAVASETANRDTAEDEGAPATAEAIVDVGADTLNVVVHDAGRPHYVRMVPGVGSGAITQALMERYGWTWEEAERTKTVVGLPGHSTLKPDEPRPDGLDHPAQQVVAEAVEPLVTEIANTLNYVRDSEAPELARVLLTGGGARLGGLSELLGRRLEVPVAPLVLDGRVRLPKRRRPADEELDALTIPAGLCLGGSR